ncbi:hypothetical protein BK120_23585 [Paenibacillus sp. FSL A5-0031]|nr:hypothetical protein BK120_23585 [Paenibacillus sp. FSL A5-0031]
MLFFVLSTETSIRKRKAGILAYIKKSKHIAELIDAFLTFTRYEFKLEAIDMKPVDIQKDITVGGMRSPPIVKQLNILKLSFLSFKLVKTFHLELYKKVSMGALS